MPNKVTLVKAAEIAASGLTPLEFMLQVLRDVAIDAPLRMEAAKNAAPYVHPKLAKHGVDRQRRWPFGSKDCPLQ